MSIYDQGIIYQLWQMEAVLVGLLQVLDVVSFHKGVDHVSLLEFTEHPSVETRIERNTHLYCKLSDLDWMGLFEVRELFPGSGAVLPLATYK